MKFIEPLRFRTLAAKALDAGAAYTGPTSITWNIAGKCENPFQVVLYSKGELPGQVGKLNVALTNRRRYLIQDTPCRKCHACLKARQKLWAGRGKFEIKVAPRTWFGTLTFRPEERVKMKILAGRTEKCNVDTLPDAKYFAAVGKQCGKEFTKFMKRVRKNHNAKLRYLMVLEEHKDGFPHIHVLIHEMMTPISKRDLESCWPYGFTKFKLSDENASWYVTKYLFKSNLARVRASIGYGHDDLLS